MQSMTIAALKHFPFGTPSWGLVGDQNVKQPLAQDLFLKMYSIRKNSKWCEFIVRSHGCRWKEKCWHAHTQAEYDEAHADDPPDPPDVEHTPLEQTLYAHNGVGPSIPYIHRAYYATSFRATTPRQRRVGSFDVRLNGLGWVSHAPCLADVMKANDGKKANDGDAGADDADDKKANDGDAAGADDGAASGSDDIAANGVKPISQRTARRSCSMAATRRRLIKRNKMPLQPGIWLDKAMEEKVAAAAEETDSDDAVVFNRPTLVPW